MISNRIVNRAIIALVAGLSYFILYKSDAAYFAESRDVITAPVEKQRLLTERITKPYVEPKCVDTPPQNKVVKNIVSKNKKGNVNFVSNKKTQVKITKDASVNVIPVVNILNENSATVTLINSKSLKQSKSLGRTNKVVYVIKKQSVLAKRAKPRFFSKQPMSVNTVDKREAPRLKNKS